jgi:HSP20 family protein
MDRWNPFREMLALREAMDRMFDDSFLRSTMSTGRAASFPIDLAETDQGFLLRATLPGVGPEDVQITIHGDTLTIRAESKAQEERKEENWLIREQRSGQYQRLISLPAPVDPDQAQAGFKDGILELTLPKAEQARPRQIKISGAPERPPVTGPGSAGENGKGGPDSASGTASTASVSPPTAPETPADKNRVTQSSEESMDASDPPSWTRERT